MVVSDEAAAAKVGLGARIEYAGLLAVATLARRIGIERAAAAGAAVMGLVGPRLRQNRRAVANLRIAFPEKSDAEIAALSRAMWRNVGRTYGETLVLDLLVADATRLDVGELARWQAEGARPGPIIGCTLHMGNWEIAIHPFTLCGRKPAGVYKAFDNPLIDHWLKTTRSALFPGGLLGKGGDDNAEGQKTARQLIERARSGGTLGFVADHFDRRAEPVPFMGRQARFITVPAMIARHVGARVWLGRCLRVGTASRFRFDIVEVPVPRSGDRKADAAKLTADIFAVFEQWIRENPEQWMWWNTRWVEPGASADPAVTAAGTGSAQ